MNLATVLVLAAGLLLGGCSLFTESTIYYIDSFAGDDAASGLSPDTPWRGTERVNRQHLLAGATVLYRRGGTYRGTLVARGGSGTLPIHYGAYGDPAEPLPLLLGSIDLSSAGCWEDDGGGIWRCTQGIDRDVGNLIFDAEASAGRKRWSRAELDEQDEFWYDPVARRLYLASTTNPAVRHTGIEAAVTRHVVELRGASDIVFQDLALKYGGAHGFGCVDTSDVIIRSCDVAWMGGGFLHEGADGKPVRYGNGIEFWGRAIRVTVERCRIWQIYDSGLTNQNHTRWETQRDVLYRYNIVGNCGMASFEYWNKPCASRTANIRFENNTCLHAGGGWGGDPAQRPDLVGVHVLMPANEAATTGISIRNNIFYGGNALLYWDDAYPGSGAVLNDHNCWYQPAAVDRAWISSRNGTLTNDLSFADFELFRPRFGEGTGSMAADPLFADPALPDVHLLPGSPCIDAGASLGHPDDFDGTAVPCGAGPDIGALERP